MATEPTQTTSSKEPKWCQCGAQPPHQRRTAKQCLYNRNRVRVDDDDDVDEQCEDVEPEKTEKFTINIGLNTISKYPEVMSEAIQEAVRRTSIIRFEANKLAQLYVIMNANNFDGMMNVPGNKHPLHMSFYMDCFYAVSCLDNENRPNVRAHLTPAWTIYNRIRNNQQWTSRSGLNQVLTYAAGEDSRTAVTNVFVHFKPRLKRYIWLQLGDIEGMVQLAGYSGIKKLATEMVDTLWRENDAEGDTDMDWHTYQNAGDLWHRLSNRMRVTASQQQQMGVFRVYQETTQILANATLPLPLSEVDVKQQVRDAFGLHLHIMAYIDQRPEVQPVRRRADNPSWNWCAATASRIHNGENTEITRPSNNVMDATTKELRRAIVGRREFTPNGFMRRNLSERSIQFLTEAAATTIREIENGVFMPAVYEQPKGWIRKFSSIPSHDYRQLHISIDSYALYSIMNRSFPQEFREFRKTDFIHNKEECWETLFDISKLKGIDGINKFFTGFITTNGVHCGFVCSRKRRQRQPIPKPSEVILKEGNQSVVWGADPGIRSLLVLENASCGHSSIHPRSTMELSASEYHAKTLHNLARDHQRQRLEENEAIATFFRDLPEKITSSQATYEQYLRASLPEGVFIDAIDFNKENLKDTWHSWINKQKVLDTFANNIWKKTEHLSKKDVVIAYGAAHFYHAMPGNRAVPVKTLKQTLSRHFLVVPTSEYRTSQTCSHNECRGNGYIRMLNVREQQEDGTLGNIIYAIKYCENCNTFWNRDINAARNIRHRFLLENMNYPPDNIFICE